MLAKSVQCYNACMRDSLFTFASKAGAWCYRHPLLCGVLLSVLSSLYLIHDYDVVNRSALPLLWGLQQAQTSSYDVFSSLIDTVSQVFGISIVGAGQLLMVVANALVLALLLLIARQLFFAKFSRWALIFLVLSHPSYNDFRAYIIPEPLFWCCWLFAVYTLLKYYRSHTVGAIMLWFVIFLFATTLTVTAWFWLLLFPFGALFWKPWRRKSVTYALLGYAFIVGILLFLPVYQGTSPIRWFITTVLNNPNSLAEVLGLNQSNWVKEESSLMAGLFVFSGATSLVVVRGLISFGFVCAGLALYAILRRQYHIVDSERLRIVIYVICFDIFISVVLLVLNKDSGSVVSFSVSLLLFLFAALGLSYVFKKMATQRFSRLSVLVIVWCLVAYVASGFIIFGPRKDYLKTAGEYAKSHLQDKPIYANDPFFLFYVGENPARRATWQALAAAKTEHTFYYAYDKNRKHLLPQALQNKTPIKRFANRRGDELLIYQFVREGMRVQ